MVPHRKPHETKKGAGKSMATSRIPQSIEANKSIKSEALEEKIQEKLRIRAAIAWRPAQGDMIQGIIVTVLLRSGNEYGSYPIIILDTGSVPYTAVHAFHTILRNQLAAIKASSGDNITIIDLGDLDSGKLDSDGAPIFYHDSVVVLNNEKAGLEYKWDAENTN
jgi:hypothetical protein